MGEPLPGPASLAGLAWLARVGPAPVEAWRSAMGWSVSVAGSHARRLERAGWLARHRMTRGQGSLLAATRRGVRMSGLAVSAPATPAPTWWAHDCACAWTAAWLVYPRARVARSARGAHRSPAKGRARMAHRNRPAALWPSSRSCRRDADRDRSRSRSSCSAKPTIGCGRSSGCTASGSASDGSRDWSTSAVTRPAARGSASQG